MSQTDTISDRGETPAERADRNFQELLQELRILQNGVQILFGFLLIFAVQPRFTELSDYARMVYIVTLFLCCVATGLFMAPVAYHRFLFARGRKPEVVLTSSRLTHSGMFALFLATVGSTLLVLDLVVSYRIAVAVTLAVAVVMGSLWYTFPLYRRHRRPGS